MARPRNSARGQKGRASKNGKKPRIEPEFSGKARKTSRKTLKHSRSGAKRRSSGRNARQTTASHILVSLIKTATYWSFVLCLWGAIAVGGLFAFYGAQMPNASSWEVPQRPPNVKIIAYDGQTVANRGLTGGEALSLGEMSPYIPQAVLAIEDRRFYSHFGIDLIGLARAMITNLQAGRTVQGGSTLTQQLAKNLFLSPDRTLERKVQEVLLSIWLEHNFTKDQIMEMYLNRVYFGSNAYGVEAAARRYFQKPASDVTLSEAALLAGLLKAPSRLSPARNPDGAEARSQVVLTAMQRAGFISGHQAKTALTEPQKRAKSYWTGSENFAADRVMDELKFLIGDVTEDLIVTTTLDLTLQKQAESILKRTLDRNSEQSNVQEGAIVSVNSDGAIRVLIGGRNYETSQFDRVSAAKRQPGSAFKPFVYAAALEQGMTSDTMIDDRPIKIGSWTPENYDGKYNGPVTLKQAMSKSLNTVAAQLVMHTGPKQVIKTAHRLGIESKIANNASIALGTSEVSLLELTSAYVPFMNGGYKATPHIIQSITTTSGDLIYENRFGRPPHVLSQRVAQQMNIMLSEVVRSGTGKNAQIPNWQVAGKTGTSQSFRDALFVGYTANLTTGVWLGNDDGSATKKVTGGHLPAMIWQEVMATAHEGRTIAQVPRVTAPSSHWRFGRSLTPDQGLTDGLLPIPSHESTSSIPVPVNTNHLRANIDRPYRVQNASQSNGEGNGKGTRQGHISNLKPGPIPPGSLGERASRSTEHGRNSILDVILGN